MSRSDTCITEHIDTESHFAFIDSIIIATNYTKVHLTGYFATKSPEVLNGVLLFWSVLIQERHLIRE